MQFAAYHCEVLVAEIGLISEHQQEIIVDVRIQNDHAHLVADLYGGDDAVHIGEILRQRNTCRSIVIHQGILMARAITAFRADQYAVRVAAVIIEASLIRTAALQHAMRAGAGLTLLDRLQHAVDLLLDLDVVIQLIGTIIAIFVKETVPRIFTISAGTDITHQFALGIIAAASLDTAGIRTMTLELVALTVAIATIAEPDALTVVATAVQ